MVSDEMKNGTGGLCFMPGIVVTMIPWFGFAAFIMRSDHEVSAIRTMLPVTGGWSPEWVNIAD